MPEYTHTLIPNPFDFVPSPLQLRAFYESMVEMEAAPKKPTMTAAKSTAEKKTVVNPFTGKSFTTTSWTRISKVTIANVATKLKGLDEFNVSLPGKGPPALPAFTFDFTGTYDFLINCCLRRQVVSTSDPHDEVPMKRKVEFFGTPCDVKDRIGVFHRPSGLAIIEVRNAGCARFWIEFEFGKMLFPEIDDSLALIEPSILEAAQRAFSIKFVQGCHWCA